MATANLAPSPRLASLDVFRGITIAAMVLANNPGAGKPYGPLQHAVWHGWTATDLVFPFFLFIVGVAIPFSLGKRGLAASSGAVLGRIWTRALALFLVGQLLAASNLPLPLSGAPAGFVGTKILRVLGFAIVFGGMVALLVPWRSKRVSIWLPIALAIVFYGYWIAMHFVRARALANGWPDSAFGAGIFNPDRLRIPGVLQRIAVCYGVAATIALFAGWRTVLAGALVLCAIYSGLMLRAPFDGHAIGSLTAEDNLARHIDVWVFDRGGQRHTYSAYPDPEGLLSTLPAIATSLLGVLAGLWLRSPRPAAERCAALLAIGVPVAIFGAWLDTVLMPINKQLWTPSFTFFCGGLAMLGLGTIFWLCDVLGWRRWAWPFTVFGMNAIAAFVASVLVLRICRWILITDSNGKTLPANAYARDQITAGMHRASAAIESWAPSLPTLATPQNTSLAYALCFLGVIFLVVLVLYLCRVFVKV